MFSYYGSKSKIINCYPRPKYGKIIEPFAGSARYSLRYPENKVVLIERDPIVAGIWNWLIHEATVSDIQRLPALKRGDDIRTLTSLSDVERNLLGFAVGLGRSTPGNIVTSRADATGWDQNDKRWRPNNTGDLLKRSIIQNLPKIRHWEIRNVSYQDYETNEQATWFIDPPYSTSAGKHYRYSKIDYETLAQWCQSRIGLVIVCEGPIASWLPFSPLQTRQKGSWKILEESLYTRDTNP